MSERKTSGGVTRVLVSAFNCLNCRFYSDKSGLPACRFCPKGKYGIMEGGTSRDMACKNLLLVVLHGLGIKRVCFRVQQAVIAIITGLSIYTPCPAGNINILIKQSV